MQSRGSGTDKPIKPQLVNTILSVELEDDAIISVDSGTITSWAARCINIRRGMHFSLSGTLASMGCGLPYASAAQIAFPTRQSIAFVGDGGFNMLMGGVCHSSSIQPILIEALTEKKPTIVEVYVDPFDPPMPQVDLEFVKKIAESFAKGQPYAKRIGLSLYRNQIHERLRDLHHHS